MPRNYIVRLTMDRQHEAMIIHNLLMEKNLRIQELEKTERPWKEEEKKKQDQEREERLANSPWGMNLGQMKQQKKEL